MDVTFGTGQTPESGAVVVGVLEGGGMTASAVRLDKETHGAIKRALEQGRFSGKRGQMVELVAPAGVKVSRILVAGLGKGGDFDARAAEALGGAVVARLQTSGVTSAAVMIDAPKGAKLDDDELAAHLALGAKLRSYRFDRYRTKLKAEDKPSLAALQVATAAAGAARKRWKELEALAAGIFLTRDLVSEPANILHPEEFVARCKPLTKLGVEIDVLGVKEMKKLGMGALLGVAQGSAREPQLLVMNWKGGKRGGKPFAIVGKGVCFDSGGISIKPADGMWDMKWDMAGAGAVAGLMHTLAARKAKANVVGIVALVENMPDGAAQRPGDIVTSASGQTIEVLNTDAEGRLILADAVWYAQDRFKPKAVVDLATLTGAIMIALGNQYAGLFANDDKLAAHLLDAARVEGEGLWRMPLHEKHDRAIDSPAADMKNISGGRNAGASIGATFIKRFIQDDMAWAHLDIAGMAWTGEDNATMPKGATGYGVRLLNRFVAEHAEK